MIFRMSRILCIIDGMTDPQFDARDYPSLSSMRLEHYIDTTCGHDAESFGCILRLLGVKDVPAHSRGYAEALGADIPVGENDLVLRGSWYGLDAEGRCTAPVHAPERIAGECLYYSLGDYKSLIVFPGEAESVHRIITYPPYDCLGKPAAQLCPQGSEVITEVFQSNLSKNHCLLLWGQSAPSVFAPFPMKAAAVCHATVVKGIARLLGMTVLNVTGATGDTDTDLVSKVNTALKAAQEFPFTLLHINGADEASHRKNSLEKAAFLRKIDKLVLSELLRSEHEIVVVSDHGTDPLTGLHIAGDQPIFEKVVFN